VEVDGEKDNGANLSSEKYGWCKASLAVMRLLEEKLSIR
jgi:hypothetical protein